MKRFHPLLVLAILLCAPAVAAPSAWHSVPDTSTIKWTARWMGTPVHGGFKRFRVSGLVDPAHPADGRLQLVVETAGVYASSPDITRALRGTEWFDVSAFPGARFTGTLADKAGHLILEGSLRIKGHTKKISFPLKLERQGRRLRLQGHVLLDRTDFGIGSGQWHSGSMIAIPVTVQFSILLVPGPSH